MSSLAPDADRVKLRTEAYAAAALAGLVAEIAGAGPGGRNLVLNTAAHRAGRLIAGGLLSLDAAEAALLGAALAVRLPLAEARSTLRSGLRAGLRDPDHGPRDLGELAPEPRPRPLELPPEKPYPAADQVAELWARCRPLCEAPELADQVRARGLDPAEIDDEDLARALPPGPWPSWMHSAVGPWYHSGHHLLVLLIDARGRPRSIHARTLRQDLPAEAKKGLHLAGYRAGGLVLADQTARALLAGPAPSWWDGETWLAEGVPDWLALATHHSDAAERRPGVLGYITGAWTEDHAARVPAGGRVVLFPHTDRAGQELAARVAATLAHARVFYAQAQDHHG